MGLSLPGLSAPAKGTDVNSIVGATDAPEPVGDEEQLMIAKMKTPDRKMRSEVRTG